MTARAVSGLDAVAHVVAHAVDVVGVVGAEGARRFHGALTGVGDGRAGVLAERGADAAWAALGRAAAGERAAVVVSGRDAACAAVPALREARRLGAPLLVVVPAHGDEAGRAVPGGPWDDVAALLGAPAGLVVAGAVREAAEVTLAALALARMCATPWCVAFDLARVGCGVAMASLPPASLLASWCAEAPGAPAELGIAEQARRAWAWVGERLPGMRAVSADEGARVVRAGASLVTGATPAVTVRQWRPFPAEELAAACGGASGVAVEEPLLDELGNGGALTTAVRLALGGASRVRAVTPEEGDGGELCVELAWNEPARGRIARALVEALSRLGASAHAEGHEPWSSVIRVRGLGGAGVARVLVCEAGALGLASVLDAQPQGALVVLLGPCEPGGLERVRGACERRGATLRHEPDATLAP